MAVRSRVVRRRVEPTEDELAELEEETQLPASDEDAGMEDEPEVVVPKKVGKPALARKAAPIVDDDDDGDDELAVKSQAKGKVTTKVVVPPAPVKAQQKAAKPVVEAPAEVEPVDVEELFGQILNGLANGQTIFITRTEVGWALSNLSVVPQAQAVATPAVAKAEPTRGLRGKAFDQEVCTPEYLAWEEEWGQLTAAEKKAKAKKAGAKWQPHADPRVEMIGLVAAYLSKLGIKKHKLEYQSLAARRALQGK